MTGRLVCIADVGNTLGECPLWDTEQQLFYWVDITEKILHRYNPDDQEIKKWDVPCEFSAIALRGDGKSIIAGTRDGFGLFDLESGSFDLFATPEKEFPENRMNDGKCDAKGRFWCGSIHEVSDPSLRKPIASLYRVDVDKSVTKIRGGIKTSNGFSWSADGATMYFTDTPTLDILAFDYDQETGAISNERVFATVPPNDGRPGGATVDVDGCLWSAHFAGSKVTKYSPDGDVLETIELPVANVTSCTFGGPDMTTLYITTAAEDLTKEEMLEQPLAGGIFTYETNTKGLPMHRFAG